MLQSRRRRRHGAYPLAEGQGGFGVWTGIITVLLVITGAWWMFSSLFEGESGVRVATILETEGGGVHVVIGGGEGEQRAEDGLRLYDGDEVRTDGGSYAVLRFFDGSTIALDGGSTLRLLEIVASAEESLLHAELERGTMWLETGTGTKVVRLLEAPLGDSLIPPRSRAIVAAIPGERAQQTLSVFDTSGPGLEVHLRNAGRADTSIIVGEGQQLSVTQEQVRKVKNGDLSPYDLRDVLPKGILESSFYQWNVRRESLPVRREETPPGAMVEGEQLTILAPKDGVLIQGSTVVVKGGVGPRVVTVRVGGYGTPVTEGGFEKEIALPESEAFTIEVQAEDREGLIVSTKTLSLTRDIHPPDPPVIVSPGASGSTVAVAEDTFEIIGEALGDTTGIIVNGYQLQKFTPGKAWRYLVDPAIGNVKVGENTYDVLALDRSGNRSIPVRITILWKAQAVPPLEREEELVRDRREYLAPDSLRIIAPTDGSPHGTSAEEVLIEGETLGETAVISINGFTLTKYVAGKTTWNYIAAERFGNYRKGKNLFTIVARNKDGKILDVLRYTIEKR